ncbi:TatD family hydrolase [Pasteurella atlantica]|uniref:TatD family hydrolase n=1 Tax=Pasteurellaceae TaxID=712 RepID=UPI00275EFC6E|nr:TatD family hydrolase [Pasteurella atlantica]MDP8099067.1 TatD family hydrolase [Pasteurella atlantica]MDP8107093.1 TatD family hydrolase [Pasteurella atlantica]MDP8116784.1 TatD family hydrolase [Pasteurella atlantica]
MRFFDTHAHLDLLASKTQHPLAELIQNAKNAGVQKIFIPSIFAKSFKNVTACCEQFPQQLVYGLGLHPYFIEQHQRADLDILAQQLTQLDPQCVAIAEIGLDKRLPPELWQKQCDFFIAQLELAKKFRLPVSLHSVKTHSELYHFLKQAQLPKQGVIHAFNGSYQQAKHFVNLGYKIGVGGSITYPRANKTRQAIAKLPLDFLVLETDSPDMPIYGLQGETNRPENIAIIFNTLCELRNEKAEEIAEIIWNTSCGIFSV